MRPYSLTSYCASSFLFNALLSLSLSLSMYLYLYFVKLLQTGVRRVLACWFVARTHVTSTKKKPLRHQFVCRSWNKLSPLPPLSRVSIIFFFYSFSHPPPTPPSNAPTLSFDWNLFPLLHLKLHLLTINRKKRRLTAWSSQGHRRIRVNTIIK